MSKRTTLQVANAQLQFILNGDAVAGKSFSDIFGVFPEMKEFSTRLFYDTQILIKFMQDKKYVDAVLYSPDKQNAFLSMSENVSALIYESNIHHLKQIQLFANNPYFRWLYNRYVFSVLQEIKTILPETLKQFPENWKWDNSYKMLLKQEITTKISVKNDGFVNAVYDYAYYYSH